jgi:hypothetical protein
MGRPQETGGVAVNVEQVLAFELISDKLPLSKLMEKELTLFPVPLLPWVRTYKSPEGREDELPQLRSNKLKAHRAASTQNPRNFFDICSPSRFPSGAIICQPSR